VQRQGNELKLVYPQPGLLPDAVDRSALRFEHWLLQPMDGAQADAATAAAIAYCQANPRWRLSIQTHKVLRIR
jgi:organic radical activating enzyme